MLEEGILPTTVVANVYLKKYLTDYLFSPKWMPWWATRITQDSSWSVLFCDAGLKTKNMVAPHECDILRDIVRSPFAKGSPGITADVVCWNSNIVANLARSAYNNMDFSGLPVLGDALEDAGCVDTEVLLHCRGGGPHTRGCWVLEYILKLMNTGTL
jgi:hypothetical protein